MSGFGEPVRPLKPSEISTREEFAAVLSALRRRAGLSVRALAQALETPTATVGDYCSGRHLPGPGQQELFLSMLRMLGVEEGQLDSWLDLVARLRTGSDARMRRVAAPYQGLTPYDIDDSARFFGREPVTQEVLQRLRDQVTGRADKGLVLVVGPSGAGKSSLLRAGVQAQIDGGALTAGRTWTTCLFSPGEKPVETLYARLADLPQQDRVIIVDQLEEVFASGTAVRDRFLEELEQLTQSGTLVLAGLRADFYDQAVDVPALLAALRASPVLIGPMTQEELRSAIVDPARSAGVQLEEGLVELLINDVAPRDTTGFAHDPGSLPLLSHALLQSWEHARGNRLTIADYRATGGIQGAVRQTAEDLYTQLTDEQQNLARRIFMRLVRVPEDGPSVRRRAPRHELDALGDTQGQSRAQLPTEADEIVDRFVAARLMTVDVDTVELSHDALLSAWPRLAAWIEQNRDGLRLHRQLTDAANDWVAADHDPALLLRGGRLQLIDEWASLPDNRSELNADERALLDESQRLALDERRAARRRARQMRSLALVSLLSAIVALVLAAVALQASDSAAHARDNALSRQIALQAGTLTPTYPSLAMQLAVLAHKISPTTGATSALLEASDGEMPTRLTGPTGPAFLSMAPQDERLAVAYSAANRVRIYALTGSVPRLLGTVTTAPRSAQTFAVALSPNGRLLAAGGTADRVTLWSLNSPGHPTRIAQLTLPPGTVYGLSFNPNGSQLAAANATRTVHVWSIQGAHARLEPDPMAAGNSALHAVQFGPDGRELAAAGTNGMVLVWRDLAPSTRPLSLEVPGAPTLNALSFSPAGQTLAVGGTDDVVHRWTLPPTGSPVALPTLHGFTSWIESLSFSPDGRDLVAGSSDSSMRIWSTGGATTPPTVLEHPAPVTGVVVTTRGTRLVSVDSAGTLRVWTLPAASAWIAPGKVFGLSYTTSGRELAVISSGPQGDAQLWSTANPNEPRLITNVATAKSFGAVAGAGAMTGDGKLLAVANGGAKVQLFHIGDPRHPQPLGKPLTGATPYIEQMAFAPSGRLLAAGDDGGHIDLWDTTHPAHPVGEPMLNAHAPAQIMLGVTFSPDGHLLASASTSGQVRLWNVASPARGRLVSTVGRFDGYAYSTAFTPDGRTLVAGGADRTVRLWNISDPSHPRPLGKPLTGPTASIYSVAVSPDGRRLAAATIDGFVWLWNITDPARPRLVASLAGSTSDLYSVTFQPHSNTLIAGGTDQQLHLWDDSPGDVAARICRIAGTPLTRSEWAEYVESGTYHPPCR